MNPDQCGSVGCVSSCKAEGHWFNSWSLVQCLVCRFGPRSRQLINASLLHGCFSLTLSPSLPFSLKINKYIFKNKDPWNTVGVRLIKFAKVHLLRDFTFLLLFKKEQLLLNSLDYWFRIHMIIDCFFFKNDYFVFEYKINFILFM